METEYSSSSETFSESEEEVVNVFNEDGEVVSTEPNTRKVYPKKDGANNSSIRGPRG